MRVRAFDSRGTGGKLKQLPSTPPNSLGCEARQFGGKYGTAGIPGLCHSVIRRRTVGTGKERYDIRGEGNDTKEK